MQIEIVPIPQGSGRITATSAIWDELIKAKLTGVAIRVNIESAKAAKLLQNSLSHRVRKNLPSCRLRSQWDRATQLLTLWISE